ncbi:MAG TPA: hypothetical protein VGS08_01800 [Candidatus Saccharimonadales bacterium]|nr:hypothetical protein [Candidatus Saccharimonadales bacterium]
MISHADKTKKFKVRTFLVYDRSSGKIVHRHRQVEEAKADTSKERLIQFVRPALKTATLDVLEIEESAMQPDKQYRVNSSGTLEEATK